MNVDLECLYCGYRWQKLIYNHHNLEGLRCDKVGCNDKNLKVRELGKNKIDYYQGTPPFPVKIDSWGQF